MCCRNSYSKYLLAYENQARAYAAAAPQQQGGASQEGLSASEEATSQEGSAPGGESAAAATPEAAPLPDDAEAVSSAVPNGGSGDGAHAQPPARPDQAEGGATAGLAAGQPQGMGCAGGPDRDGGPAMEAEQHAGEEVSGACLAGAHGDAESPPAQEVIVDVAAAEAGRAQVKDVLMEESTPAESSPAGEIQGLTEGGGGSQAPAIGSVEAGS